MMEIDVSQINDLEATLRQSLVYLDNSDSQNVDLTDKLLDQQSKVELAFNKMDEYSQQALQHEQLDEEDKRRLSLGLNTRTLKSYKEKYQDYPEIQSTFKNYSQWSSTLGFEPPSFGVGITGGKLRQFRNGSLTEYNSTTSQIEQGYKDSKDYTQKMADAIQNASAYKQVLEQELHILQDIQIPEDDEEKDLKQGMKELAISEMETSIKFWERVSKYAQVQVDETSPYGFTFNNLEFIADPVSGIDYTVDTVYFDFDPVTGKRDYVIEISFSEPTNEDEALDITRYIVQDLMLDTVAYIPLTDEEKSLNPSYPTDVNLQRVELRTKFGIIPNAVYNIAVNLTNINDATKDFIRRVGPKPNTVSYLSNKEVHVTFTADIDLDLEGIREETQLFLNRENVGIVHYYSLVESTGNIMKINYAYLDQDYHTVVLMLDGVMNHGMGYTLQIENIYFEDGNTIAEENNQIHYVYTNPFPILGVVGKYDNTIGMMMLMWLPSIQENMSGYNVYRLQNDERVYTKINTASIPEEKFIDISVLEGNRYKYVVTVLNMLGDESTYSEPFSISI